MWRHKIDESAIHVVIIWTTILTFLCVQKWQILLVGLVCFYTVPAVITGIRDSIDRKEGRQ